MKQMGCTLEQSEDSTTVRGPPVGSSQLVGVDVDMADMTDAFMTAVAVAAAAKGTTRISGIANQHVKECDRMAAMCEGLALCGDVARNNPDGIEIDGVGGLEGGVGALAEAAAAAVGKVEGGAYIDCYDDHRIAMSFAVLSCACAAMGYDGPMGAAPVITDKECTDKTYRTSKKTGENWGKRTEGKRPKEQFTSEVLVAASDVLDSPHHVTHPPPPPLSLAPQPSSGTTWNRSSASRSPRPPRSRPARAVAAVGAVPVLAASVTLRW